MNTQRKVLIGDPKFSFLICPIRVIRGENHFVEFGINGAEMTRGVGGSTEPGDDTVTVEATPSVGGVGTGSREPIGGKKPVLVPSPDITGIVGE